MFMVLLRQLYYALKNQLKACKMHEGLVLYGIMMGGFHALATTRTSPRH